jgi:hypothetical protein
LARDVYVAGRVSELGSGEDELYARLETAATRYGWTIALPIRDSDVDRLEPRDFAMEIAARIERSQCVVTVLQHKDQSVPVEAAMASYLHKQQVLVVYGMKPPRILAGLPGVASVLDAKESDTIIDHVGKLLEDW